MTTSTAGCMTKQWRDKPNMPVRSKWKIKKKWSRRISCLNCQSREPSITRGINLCQAHSLCPHLTWIYLRLGLSTNSCKTSSNLSRSDSTIFRKLWSRRSRISRIRSSLKSTRTQRRLLRWSGFRKKLILRQGVIRSSNKNEKNTHNSRKRILSNQILVTSQKAWLEV